MSVAKLMGSEREVSCRSMTEFFRVVLLAHPFISLRLVFVGPSFHLRRNQIGQFLHLILNIVVIWPLGSDFGHSSSTAQTD
jgi:hypothetical protein